MRMDNHENIPEELFDLFQKGKYESLVKSEQELVSQLMTPEEFDESHRMIRSFQNLDQIVESSIASNHEQPKSTPWWQKEISILKCILIGITLALIGFFLGRNTAPTDVSNDNQIIFASHPDSLGKSLAEDNYPDQLVVTF